MDFHKCACPHCGQSVEYPAEGMGQTVPCPTCEKPFRLFPDIAIPSAKTTVVPTPTKESTVAPTPTQKPTEQRRSRSKLSKLTEETIRARTKAGDTPLHRAAKKGQFGEIPSHLLSIELFTVKNNAGETPLHVAAKHGHLDQVPRQFLTKETMTIRRGDGSYLTGSGKVAHTDTPLHMADADQIPKQFLTPESLSLRASGYQMTLLHRLAYQNRLDLVPQEYANSDIWNLTDYMGRTARDVIQENEQRAAYVSQVRSEPATEKQKEKLRYFDYDVKAGMTKGEASDAIDDCVRKFPEVNQAYYNRPATKEQLAKLRAINKSPDVDPEEPYYDPEEPLTYQEAKDAINAWRNDQIENTYQCMGCEAIFKVRSPETMIGTANASTLTLCTSEDGVQVKIPCPRCGSKTIVHSLWVCKCICPNCLEECFVAKSQTGQSVKHLRAGCMKDFLARQSQPRIMEPKTRLMRYAELDPFLKKRFF